MRAASDWVITAPVERDRLTHDPGAQPVTRDPPAIAPPTSRAQDRPIDPTEL